MGFLIVAVIKTKHPNKFTLEPFLMGLSNAYSATKFKKNSYQGNIAYYKINFDVVNVSAFIQNYKFIF